jgi:hypothetical protein
VPARQLRDLPVKDHGPDGTTEQRSPLLQAEIMIVLDD